MRQLRVPSQSDFSSFVITEKYEKYPQKLVFNNRSVARIEIPSPGIVEVESFSGTDQTLVISGGIHGDEKAGIIAIDEIVSKIISGRVEVLQNLLLVYGNLKAMSTNNGAGSRCIESELGAISNLNRCFNQGIFRNPQNYAQKRANQITESTQRLVLGSIESIDIHQSFKVPTVGQVRGIDSENDYTYAMIYPIHGVQKSLGWVRKNYSDIVAGVVLNKIEGVHHKTFAGYMAQEFGANAGTFEQGEIGRICEKTFTPQLIKSLLRKISGKSLQDTLAFDVWDYAGDIIKKTEKFTFVSADGKPEKKSPPMDFVPLGYGFIAEDQGAKYYLKEGQRLLFSNPEVPIGDRAAVIVEAY